MLPALREGQRVTVVFGEGTEEVALPCRVHAVRATSVLLEWDAEEPDDELLRLFLPDDTEDVAWMVDCVVLASGAGLVEVTLPSGVRARRIQRRAHVRVKLDAPVEVTRGETSIHGRTLNLSGGGVGLHLPRRLPEGSFVEIRLQLPASGELAVTATVLHVSRDLAEADAPAPVGWLVGLQFETLTERDTDRVISLVFRLQAAELAERRRRLDWRDALR